MEILIFIRCVLSFLPIYNKFTEWVYNATEPMLAPCRKLLGNFGLNLNLDFSPIIVLLIIRFLQRIILGLLIPLI
ncbi:MAG: YggT family protein [Clostridia bacterium]|nr:YggT family protein [Clostridia bacterium]